MPAFLLFPIFDFGLLYGLQCLLLALSLRRLALTQQHYASVLGFYNFRISIFGSQMPLPDQIPLRYSDEDAGYVSMRPVVRQTFRLPELIDMIVSVVGKDPDRVRQILHTGTVVYNGYRYTWDSLSADPAEITSLLAPFPDDDPSRPFDASKCSAVLLESGGGTQRTITELSQHDLSTKKFFAKDSPLDVLVKLAVANPPHYEKYSHARHADLFRLALSYDRAQQLLAALIHAAPRSLRHRWVALRPPAAITFVSPR
jgi:hypothetical protein